MGIKIDYFPKSKVKLETSFDQKESISFFEKALESLGKNVEIPGFRKGFVPKEILKDSLSREEILNEVAKIVSREVLEKAQEEFDLQIISQPQIFFKKIDETKIEATFEFFIFPKVSIQGWKDVVKTTKKREIKVLPAELEEVLKDIQRSRAKLVRKTTGAQKGDEILIDGEIRSGGVKIENGDIKNQRIILGERKMVQGFEENLLGLKENEEKEFSIKIPEDFWQKKWAGKNLEFKIKVKAVFQRELPTLDDEFARSLGNFENLEKLKESIKEGLLIEKEEAEKTRWASEVISKIVQISKIDLPEIMIEKEKEILLEELKARVEENGLPFSEYLLQLNLSEEKLKEGLTEAAQKRLKEELVIAQIAKEEDIKVSQEEIEDKINQILKNFPSVEEAQKLDLPSLKDYFYQRILFEKVLRKFEELYSS
jgi:trigger factor